MMMRVRKLAAIPFGLGRFPQSSTEPISYNAIIQHRGVVDRKKYVNLIGSTKVCARPWYSTLSFSSILTHGSPWKDKADSIIYRRIALAIEDLCAACYWRENEGENNGYFSLSDLAYVDGKFIIPPSKLGDGLLKESFKNTVGAIFAGASSSSPDFIDFMDRVENITDKEDYRKISLHPLLKDKEGRIQFVIDGVDWVRGHTRQHFDFTMEYAAINPANPTNPINIFNIVGMVETQDSLHDTFDKIYQRGRMMYRFNNAWAVATYVRNAFVHFKETRLKNQYHRDFSRQWVACKLYEMFSSSYSSHLQMYWFLEQHDNKNEIKLDMKDEFRGIRRP